MLELNNKIMKLIDRRLLAVIAMLAFFTSVNAQVFEITTYGSEYFVFGDFTKKEMGNNGAGYVNSGTGGGLELNYYLKNNLGIGLKASGAFFDRDVDAYQSDIKDKLGINDDTYNITNSYGFWSFGSELGVSYLIDLSEKLQLEPYMYLGVKILVSPSSSVVYLQDGFTYTYETKKNLYPGFSYSPGVRLKWNVHKHVGLNVYAEYQGNSYMDYDERSINYSYNSLELEDVNKKYSINAIAMGLGLTFRLGKGLNE